MRPKGLQMSQQGERKQGFETRLKKRSLRKQELSLQKLRSGKAKKARRSQEMG